jgi:hypothetical protein
MIGNLKKLLRTAASKLLDCYFKNQRIKAAKVSFMVRMPVQQLSDIGDGTIHMSYYY